MRHLLDANKENYLTLDEHAELDEFEKVNHFVMMLKAFARQHLNTQK